MYYNAYGRPLDDKQVLSQMGYSDPIDSQPAYTGIPDYEGEWVTKDIEK